MRAILIFVGALGSVGCTDPCPSVAAAGIDPSAQVFYRRPGGLSWTAYLNSTPSGAGVVIGNSCDPPGSASQFDTAACEPATGDSGCAACLKAHCCSLTLAWVAGIADAGAGLASCIDANCNAACTRSP